MLDKELRIIEAELVQAFGKKTTEAIIIRVICGQSLDSAIQDALED